MKDEIFFARWVLLLVIVVPPIMLAAIFVEKIISLLLFPLAVVPWMIHFREDIMELMRTWYRLVRGRRPKRRD